MTTDNITRQIEREEESLGLGVNRYNQKRPAGNSSVMPWRADRPEEREECDLKPGKNLLGRTVPLLVAAIEEFMADAGAGRAARRSISYKYLQELDVEAVAYLTCRRMLNALMKMTKTVRVAMSISESLEDHAMFVQLSADHPGLLKSTLQKMKTRHAGHRRGAFKRAAREAEVVGLTWADADKLHLGMKLLELFIDTTKLATTTRRKVRRKTVEYVEPAADVRQWLMDRHEDMALLEPLYMPMLVPPQAWTTPKDGGYMTDGLRHSVRLVRTQKKDTIDELFSADMPEVYAAVNALQGVGYRINRAVYHTFRAVWDSEGLLGGLPQRFDDPLPTRPEDIPEHVKPASLPETQRLRLMAWKAATSAAYGVNAGRRSKVLEVAQKAWLAEKHVDEAVFYFPYSMDFRSRIYPQPTGLNPQGDDLAKGLLEFSEGKPLGEDGAFWLAVHVANTFGEADKLPLAERVQWTLAHEAQILDSALNPLDGERFWTTADGGDNAWQALAACVEWAGYKIAGADHASHLPIGMDGSCSGLQHYSALLRDETGASAVNLAPSERGNDIYTEVAKAVELCLQVPDEGKTDMAAAWRGKVVRKIVKQPCMTFAYSATRAGMRDQIRDAMDKLDGTGNYLGGISHFDGANFLSAIVEECIRDTVIAAAGAMDWLQDVAEVLSKDNFPIIWTTPVGLPVRQDARKLRGRRIAVLFMGRVMKLSLTHDTQQINGRKQRASVAPNFIHSMDAAHLMKTVNACAENGINSLAVVHDSFGTHACDVTAMNYLLRREFVEMYSADLLKEFRDEIAEQHPELADQLPPLPSTGSFELAAVMDSEFFFA